MNDREPQPRTDTPRCPTWLSPEAKKVWKRMLPELQQMGVLTYVDGDALAAYCQTYARWRKAEEFLNKHGDTYPLRDARGRVKYLAQFPQVAIARNLLQQLRGLQKEFGLTPSARTGIEVQLPADGPRVTDFPLISGRFDD